MKKIKTIGKNKTWLFLKTLALSQDEVWDYFEFSQELQQAKCKIYEVLLKYPGSTTSTITKHLKTKHKIDIIKCNILAPEADDISHVQEFRIFLVLGLKLNMKS